MTSIEGLRVAILVTDGFEQVELTEPHSALVKAGALVSVVSPKETKTPGKIQGMHHDEPGDQTVVDVELEGASPGDFDALVLPGGVANPDALRISKPAVAFVRHFAETGKPIAAICHGPWTLIEAEAVKGLNVTSWPSLKTDLRNAGALWSDKDVVQDGVLVTSRKPSDLPAFCKAMIDVFGSSAQKQAA